MLSPSFVNIQYLYSTLTSIEIFRKLKNVWQAWELLNYLFILFYFNPSRTKKKKEVYAKKMMSR